MIPPENCYGYPIVCLRLHWRCTDAGVVLNRYKLQACLQDAVQLVMRVLPQQLILQSRIDQRTVSDSRIASRHRGTDYHRK